MAWRSFVSTLRYIETIFNCVYPVNVILPVTSLMPLHAIWHPVAAVHNSVCTAHVAAGVMGGDGLI
jgi:hypothetical protein